MPLSFNGNSPEVITFNGNDVETVVYNGDTIWTKPQSTYTITYSNLDYNSTNSWIVYNGKVKSGSGSITVNQGDTITCRCRVNSGSNPPGYAQVYLNGSEVASTSTKYAYDNATVSYNYTPAADSSISWRSWSSSNNYSRISITT